MTFDTKPTGAAPDVIAPDGSEVRILYRLSRGALAVFTLPPGAVSAGIPRTAFPPLRGPRHGLGPSHFGCGLLCHRKTMPRSRRSIGQPRLAMSGPAVRRARAQWNTATLRLRFVPSRRVAHAVLG